VFAMLSQDLVPVLFWELILVDSGEGLMVLRPTLQSFAS
jgi:hypothetical protein